MQKCSRATWIGIEKDVDPGVSLALTARDEDKRRELVFLEAHGVHALSRTDHRQPDLVRRDDVGVQDRKRTGARTAGAVSRIPLLLERALRCPAVRVRVEARILQQSLDAVLDAIVVEVAASTDAALASGVAAGVASAS